MKMTYIAYFGTAIALILLIFLVVAHAEIALWKKLFVFIAVVAAALFVYFGSTDIIGRPSPFGNDEYIVTTAIPDTMKGMMYIFTEGKIGSDTLDPRLFRMEMWNNENGEKPDGEELLFGKTRMMKEMAKMKKMQDEGKQVKIKLLPKRKWKNRNQFQFQQRKQYGNRYESGEQGFEQYDPLEMLPYKKKPNK